jgi:hypothetical protein
VIQIDIHALDVRYQFSGTVIVFCHTRYCFSAGGSKSVSLSRIMYAGEAAMMATVMPCKQSKSAPENALVLKHDITSSHKQESIKCKVSAPVEPHELAWSAVAGSNVPACGSEFRLVKSRTRRLSQ